MLLHTVHQKYALDFQPVLRRNAPSSCLNSYLTRRIAESLSVTRVGRRLNVRHL